MPSDYTPSVSPYLVPDDTDAPDVPAHLRQFAARLGTHGFRARWEAGVRMEGLESSAGPGTPGTLQPGFAGHVASVANTTEVSTYAPRWLGFAFGFIVAGSLGDVSGHVGVTNAVAGGTWIGKTRYDTQGQADTHFTLPVWAPFYYQGESLSGVSLYVTVASGGSGLAVREAQITMWGYPLNK